MSNLDWTENITVLPKKKAISIRIDADVIDYLKQESPNYQRLINAILRVYMNRKKKY